jgi:hypothetical protein
MVTLALTAKVYTMPPRAYYVPECHHTPMVGHTNYIES